MKKKVLDHNPDTGVTEYFHYDHSDDTYTIETVQDCSDIIEANKAQQNEGFDKKADMWHAATIPAVVQLEWMTKFGVDLYNKDHWPAVKRLLNSSEYAYLRRNEFKL